MKKHRKRNSKRAERYKIDELLPLGLSPYLGNIIEQQGIKTIEQLRAKVRHKNRLDLHLFLSPGYLTQKRSLTAVAHFVGFLTDLGLAANEIHGMFVDAERIGRIRQLKASSLEP